MSDKDFAILNENLFIHICIIFLLVVIEMIYLGLHQYMKSSFCLILGQIRILVSNTTFFSLFTAHILSATHLLSLLHCRGDNHLPSVLQ